MFDILDGGVFVEADEALAALDRAREALDRHGEVRQALLEREQVLVRERNNFV